MKNEIFEANPHLEKVFVAADGQAFYQESDAQNYAKSLEDKAVKTVLNPLLLEVDPEEEVLDGAPKMTEFEEKEATPVVVKSEKNKK
jgi:hypothetical protein